MRCFALIALALAAAAEEVRVVVVGSQHRPELFEAQRRTFGRALQLQYFSESDSECVLCTDGMAWDYRRLFGTTTAFSNRSGDYYCGNQRHLQALRAALLLHPPSEWPRWFLAIDDDTYVSPTALLQLLHAHDEEAPLVVGDRWGGGAGFAFSRAAARRLLAPVVYDRMRWTARGWRRARARPSTVLDACIGAQLGGSLCYAPADWATSECAVAAGIAARMYRSRMQQDCVWQAGALPKGFAEGMVTCHHLNATQMVELHARLGGD